MNVREKIEQLRTLMKERNMDAYMIPTSDFHETEYVGEHFKARQYMSGFSGSAGTLIVTKQNAGLWTDGRYFIQAADQLANTGIDLMKEGEEGVLPIAQYLFENIVEGGCLGFDGRVMNTKLVKAISNRLAEKHIAISYEEDLIANIWQNRPELPKEKGFFLELSYSGKSTADKMSDIKDIMKKQKADFHIVTSLDDIAWILNMRGKDIACFPVVLAYLVIAKDTSYVFLDEDKLTPELLHNFKENNVLVKAYEAIYEFVKTIPSSSTILLDSSKVNYKITQSLAANMVYKDRVNPSQLMKAMKNEMELKNNRASHIKDGVAVTKFMYWLKHTIGKETITEISASDFLASKRFEQEHCLDLSFSTISAYKEHAAMMHYSATPETNATLQAEGLLLVDSGGQYLEGTTDITRTFVLGPISDEIRLHFTTALRSLIALSKARFLYGCRGMNLDVLARGPIWDLDLDYKCGTGHGVGHLLNVHEGPNGFRWKIVPERSDSCILEEGMTQSNEPGIYVEGSHGIRHENEMVVRSGEKNEYGQFMYFETITFVPFDLDGIDTMLLTPYEKQWLNAYHKEVYEKISPYVTPEEQAWLQVATRSIS